MNRLSTLFFAVALLLVSVTALALIVRAGAVAPAWAPVPASAETAPGADGPGATARF